jgi:hypothetical protein
VKAVDKFETERGQERDEQEQVREKGLGFAAGDADVGLKAVGDEQDGDGEQANKNKSHSRIEPAVEFGPDRAHKHRCPRLDRSVGHGIPFDEERTELCRIYFTVL